MNLCLEKTFLIARKVSLNLCGIFFQAQSSSDSSSLLFRGFKRPVSAMFRPGKPVITCTSHLMLSYQQAPLWVTVVNHCCETLKPTDGHTNSAALDWSWRGKSRSWIKIWDARLRWSPSLLQFPGCNCDIRCLLLTVFDGARRKDHSGHWNVLLVNTQ